MERTGVKVTPALLGNKKMVRCSLRGKQNESFHQEGQDLSLGKQKEQTSLWGVRTIWDHSTLGSATGFQRWADLYFKWFPYPKGPGSWTCLGFLPWTCPLQQGPSASTVRGWKPQSHCWRAWIPETTNMSSFPVTLGNEVEKGAGGWWWLWVKWLGGLERVWKNSGLWVVQKKHLLCA